MLLRVIVLLAALALAQSSESLKFKPHSGATVPSPKTIICPDKTGTCPDGSTCCLLATGRYGCCPYDRATCCSDKLHCCPYGYTCNVTVSECIKADTKATVPIATSLLASGYQDVQDVPCADNKTYCPGQETCCRLSAGGFGCCPYAKGICCSDGLHCCPFGYKCDTAQSRCLQGNNVNNWFSLSQARPLSSNPPTSSSSSATAKNTPKTSSAVAPPAGKSLRPSHKKKNMCPGGKSSCDNGRTCCYMENGHFGCCSFVNGTCCSDRKHCCPLGFTCDMKLGKCTKGGGLSLPWGATEEPKSPNEDSEAKEPVEGGVNYVICPDRVSQCPDGSTCCSLLSGEWGCCPMPKAVCCSDRLHCCPSGSQCDVSAGTCIHPSTSWETTVDPISVPFALLSEYNGHASAEWCDEDSFCPIGTHCVNIQDELRCSPFPKPVTCFDNLHVCPEGSQCDQSSGLCHYPSAPWEEKRPAVRDPVTSDPVTSDLVTCDDNTTSCDFGTTCCLMLDGHYSCCPFPFAVCCSDKLHCCPDHTECDIQKGECRDRDSSRSLWGQKSRSGPLFQIANNIIPSPDQSDKAVSSVICPDQSSTCPDSTTCCKLITGQYGCCPLPEATCCSDGSHCCPQGYKCDPSHGACLKIVDTELIPQASDGSLEVSPVSSIVCPDKTSQCQSGSTCCLLPDKTYGCCPIPNAVCCADHLHCCPAGTTCDTKTMTCSHQESSLTISWSDVGRSLALVAPVQTDNNVGKTVICKDKTQCPQGSTCCLMTSGAYGCCPYNNGSCCSDKIHCCPNGFECSSTGTSCQKKGSSLVLSSEQFTRNQAVVKDSVLADKPTLSDSVADVPCPGGKASCASGQTCCQLKSGDYGCCPFPQATCCADGQHCCPQGFACDPQSGTCTQSIPWLNKIPALRRQPAARALP